MRTIGITLSLLLLLPCLSLAGRVNVTWTNEFTVDAIHLWIVEDEALDVDFDRIRLSDPTWSFTMEEDHAVFSGDPADPFDLTARIRFSERSDFGVAWAEIYQGEVVASGTNRFLDGGWVYSDNGPITQAPVPLPGAVWLLAGGLALLALQSPRRRLWLQQIRQSA